MALIQSQLSGDAVLQAFQKDAPYLFLGAAFLTTGAVSIGFCALRRKFNDLLMWMGLFAALYGLRLWLQDDLLDQILDGSWLVDRLPAALSSLIPIPAFTFFRLAGFFGNRDKPFRSALKTNGVFLVLFAATLIVGPWRVFTDVGSVTATVMLWIMLVGSLRKREGDRDFKVVRAGVLFFLIFALWDFTIGAPYQSKLEPFGFAILLACLGYVAARRTVERDVELSEIQNELDMAQRMQRSTLPGSFPRSTDFRIAARYLPMTAVAGDLYDYLVSGDRQAGLFIADVSGHGVPAALIASMVKMAATSQRLHVAHPAKLLAGMNVALCGNTQGQFVTAAYVYLNAATRQMRYSAAGHPAMFLLRDGAVTEVAENGLILAAWEGADYTEKMLPLHPGDRLLLYTDGLVEARNAEGKLFGEEALMNEFRATAGMPPEDAADRLIAAALQWAKSQDDDLTVLVCDYLGDQ